MNIYYSKKLKKNVVQNAQFRSTISKMTKFLDLVLETTRFSRPIFIDTDFELKIVTNAYFKFRSR